MRAAALGNACGARAASVPLTVAAAPLPSSASASPLSIGVAARGGVATSRAGFSAASALSSRGARRSSVVSRAVDGGSLSSVSLGPSASSSSSAAAPAAGGVGGSKATVVLPLDQVDLTSEVRSSGCPVVPCIVIRGLGARSGSGRGRLREPPIWFQRRFFPLVAGAVRSTLSQRVLSYPFLFLQPPLSTSRAPLARSSTTRSNTKTTQKQHIKHNKSLSHSLGRDRLDQAPRPARLGRLPRRRRRAPRAADRARRPGRRRAQLGLLLRGEEHARAGPARDGRAVAGGVQREVRLLGAAGGLAVQQEEVRESVFFFSIFFSVFFFPFMFPPAFLSRGDNERN